MHDMFEEVIQMDLDCQKAACHCDTVMQSLDSLEEFSIESEDARDGGVPATVEGDARPNSFGITDYEDPNFDHLADVTDHE